MRSIALSSQNTSVCTARRKEGHAQEIDDLRTPDRGIVQIAQTRLANRSDLANGLKVLANGFVGSPRDDAFLNELRDPYLSKQTLADRKVTVKSQPHVRW